MLNSYDEQYEFRVANINDIEKIMEFIDSHWKKGHIMAINREFLNMNFLRMMERLILYWQLIKIKRTIECLNGFLKASHDKEYMDVWGSIWKVLDGNRGMLGAELIKRRQEMTGCRCDLDVGDNPKTAIPVLKVLLKRYTCKMHHYYMLADFNDFKIAKVKTNP